MQNNHINDFKNIMMLGIDIWNNYRTSNCKRFGRNLIQNI